MQSGSSSGSRRWGPAGGNLQAALPCMVSPSLPLGWIHAFPDFLSLQVSVTPQPGSSSISRAGSLHKPTTQPEEKKPETPVSRLERREQLKKANTLPTSVTGKREQVHFYLCVLKGFFSLKACFISSSVKTSTAF